MLSPRKLGLWYRGSITASAIRSLLPIGDNHVNQGIEPAEYLIVLLRRSEVHDDLNEGESADDKLGEIVGDKVYHFYEIVSKSVYKIVTSSFLSRASAM